MQSQILLSSFKNLKSPLNQQLWKQKFQNFFSFFVLAIVLGCSRDKEEFNPKNEKIFFENISEKNYSLTNQSDLNELSKVLSKEPKEIEFLKNATLVTLKDSQGEYEAISVQYQVGDFITKLTVPLTQVSSEKMTGKEVGGTTYYMVAGCEMKCTSESGCGTCTQEVIERCKTQKCTCSSVGGTCTGSVIFPE